MPTPQNDKKKPVSNFISFLRVLSDLERGGTQKFIFNNSEFLIIKIK